MPSINLAYVAELILKYGRKFLYASKLLFFFTLVSAMITSFIASFVIFYNLIQQFFNFVTHPSTGTMLDKVFGLMNCMGIVPAFNDNKAILISALLFLLYRILYIQFLKVYALVADIIKPLIG